jgi:hypothetical protein
MFQSSELRKAAQHACEAAEPGGSLVWSAGKPVRFGAMAAFLLLVTLYVPIVSGQPTRDRQLDQLLTRLGLVDLQILHLERTLQDRDARNSGSGSSELAQRLADLYAGRLMDQSGDKPAYEETLQRIQNLINRHPEANTTALQVMVLQADYNRAESLIGAWTADPQNQTAQTDARTILSRIAPVLDRHQQELSQQVDKLTARMDGLEDGDELKMLEREARRVQNVTARATYFAAWANYYLPVVSGDTDAASYERARTIFRELLGIDEEPIELVDVEWLGLESIWRSRALIGLGLCEAACGKVDACDRCFELLESSGVPTEVKEQAPYWYTRALVQAGQMSKAVDFARNRVERLRPPATQGQVSFCVFLVRTGYSPSPLQRTDEHRELGRLGLNGLARLQQMSAIRSLVERYEIAKEGAAEFVLLWARGQKQFGEAERAKSEEGYRSSIATLQEALKTREADSLAPQAAECRYTLGWCHYRLKEFQKAAQEFEKAVAPLKAAGNSLAVEAAWMAFTAYRRLTDEQPRYLSAASDVLKRLQRDFPDHPYARRADYEKARLMSDRSPEEMIRSLEAIPKSDPNYASARFDLTLAWRRKWNESKSTAAREQASKGLNDAALSYLETDPEDSSRKVKCCLLIADAALKGDPPDRRKAEQFLRRAEQWVDSLPDGNATRAEYHYRRLQLATAAGDQDSRQQHAAWLTANGAGSPYEVPALTVVASGLDREVRAAKEKGQTGPIDKAHGAFQRLSSKLGNSAEALASNKNAQVALSRLAHYAAETGNGAQAAESLDQLLAVFPKDRQYLRRAGMADYQAGNFDRSLERWRTLLAGLPKSADSWFEAKYYQIKCLEQTAPPQAQKVLRQFQLLHPKLGPPAWRDKFRELTE